MKRIIEYLISRDFLIKILLPAFLTIILFVISIFQIIIPRFEDAILDRKREMIRQLTNSALTIIERQYKLEQQGSKSIVDAQFEAIEQIRNLRYGEELKDYFWIINFQPKMIMHPYRTELEGKDLSDFKDSHNKKLFVEIVKVVKNSGEGYVDYMWQWKDDSTRIVPKLSYVKEFQPWNWIIGTGIYLEDVKIEIALLERNLINISITIALIISALLVFITIQNIKIEKQRRQFEDELRISKEKYKTLVEATTEGLIMLLEGEKIFFNKTLLTMLGYSGEEFLKLNLEDIFVNSKNNLELSNYSNIETQLKKSDGTLLNVLLTISPISFMGKKGVIIIVKDISQHKEIEEALGKTKEKYRILTNQLTIGVFRADVNKNFKFIEINTAVADILGSKNIEQIYHSSLTDYFDDIGEAKIFWKELIKSGSLKNKIIQIRRSDGNLAIVSVSIVIVNDEEGIPRFCDGIIEDITASKRTEEERESLISELQVSLIFLNKSIKPFIKEYISAELNQPVSKIIKVITQNKTEAVLLKTSTGEFVGILTYGDIRDRILGNDLGLETPAYEVMTSPLISIEINSSILEALLKFYEKNIEHLVVKDENNKICGILKLKDIQEANYLTYLFFLKNIQKTTSLDEIGRYRTKLLLLLKALIDSGTHSRIITRMITLITDTITQKIISLAFEELGVPPTKFAFIALGSEGREEQTLVTDQDNALVYEDVEDSKKDLVKEYFLKLGEYICTALNHVGYTYCTGNIMAKNPMWCQPISVWKKYFTDWVTTASPQDLLDVSIFFDFRLVYGEQSLYDRLLEQIQNLTSGNNPFFVYLSQNALRFKPPIGQLKSKEVFNIKLAIIPLVDLVRIYALKNKIKPTNTIERIEQLYKKNVLSNTGYQELLQGYNYLMQIRFKHQIKLLTDNHTPDNNINPKHITELEENMLRRIFTQIIDFQTKLSLDFKGTL